MVLAALLVAAGALVDEVEGGRVMSGAVWLLWPLACVTAYWVLATNPSRETCKRLFLVWVFLLIVASGIVLAADVYHNCDWDLFVQQWGWCTPCAWLAWSTAGCV